MEEPVTYRKNSEFFTTSTGIRLHKTAHVSLADCILMGGKNIIYEGAVLRGDLRKISDNKVTSINMGRYSYLEKNVILRPPFKFYKNEFTYLPIKVGDYVFIGEGTIINALSIYNNVHVGKNCVIGRFAVIKSCVKILDNTVIPPYAVIPSHTIYGGSPARQVGDLSDFTAENFEKAAKERYRKLQLH